MASSASASGDAKGRRRRRLVFFFSSAAAALMISLWPWLRHLLLLAAAASGAAVALRRPRVWMRAAVLGPPPGRGGGNAAAAPRGASRGWAIGAIVSFAAVGAKRAASRAMLKRPKISSILEIESGAAAGERVAEQRPSILDLPDLAIDSILARLPAASLLQAAAVCKDLRARCTNDHLWEALVYEKWGKLAGPEAYRAWRRQNAGAKEKEAGASNSSKGFLPSSSFWSSLWCLWPPSWINLARECSRKLKKVHPPVESLMDWYWALETGKFWFRAQVYNRENGHVGFILSCYDAELSYDRSTDSFRARYPPHGSRAVVIEDGVPWERLRALPVETAVHSLHASDCLAELRPGDHIEVQWRRNKEFPYGWWYGVVGHSETCSASGRHCACLSDNTIWLVFNQYTASSRWRRAAIDRQNHREEGNEAEGFYGGVRKLRTKDEISVWESLWPAEVLE